MYVGVIRGDMPGPIFMSDLEPTSQTNYPTEPFGQSRNVSRPNAVNLTNFLAGVYASTPQGGAPAVTIPIPANQTGAGGVPAGIEGTGAVTFPVTLTGSNNVLRVKNASAASFTAVTIATGVYNTMAALLTAVNAALSPSAAGVVTTTDSTGTLVVLQSTVPGVGSYVAVDTTGNGSTFNTPANLASGGANFTMPSATTIITALLPIGGPLNVSAAAVLTNLGASPAAANAVSFIAPHFVETVAAIESFMVGVLSKYLESTFNPDPTLLPALPNSPAITVVQDDGTSLFVAPLPIITGAVHNSPNTGDLTITGSNLGNAESFSATYVRVTGASPGPGLQSPYVRLNQKVIAKTFTGGTQGSVTPTSIVIPASLLTNVPPGSPFPPLPPAAGVPLGVAGSTVKIEYLSFSNTNYGTAASLTTVASGLATLTGLTNMTAAMVGGKLTLAGCASAANNGTFFIAAYISATSVQIANTFAVASDGNNGAIVWSQPPPISFVVT